MTDDEPTRLEVIKLLLLAGALYLVFAVPHLAAVGVKAMTDFQKGAVVGVVATMACWFALLLLAAGGMPT